MPLQSSLWVDEMGTAFVIKNGAADPSLRAVPQVTQSVYYSLPALAVRFGGSSEIVLRLFSILAMAVALGAIARIATRLMGANVSWLVVFGCLGLRSFNFQASDARPYALGSCVLALAILFLMRWMDSRKLVDGLIFGALGVLLWWVHLIFWPFYLLFVLYACMRLRTGYRPSGWLQIFVVGSLIAAGCLPVVANAVTVLKQAQAHVVVTPPTFQELWNGLKLSTITGAATGALLAAWIWRWTPTSRVIAPASFALMLGWWLIDPLALFGYSVVTGNSVFVERYFYLAAPGVVLVSALFVSRIVPAQRLKTVSLWLGAGILVLCGHWNRLWPAHTNSDWRAASATLQAWRGSREVPVICPSPFVEARSPVWRPDMGASGFLYSNLTFYGTPGSLYAFPFEPSREAEIYATLLSQQSLSHVGRFAIYGGSRNVQFWTVWFAARPELQGWTSRSLGTFGDVEVAAFEAPARFHHS